MRQSLVDPHGNLGSSDEGSERRLRWIQGNFSFMLACAFPCGDHPCNDDSPERSFELKVGFSDMQHSVHSPE